MSLPLGRRRHAACLCGSGRGLATCCLPWEEAFRRLFSRALAFAAAPPVRRHAERAAPLFWITEEPLRPGKARVLCESLHFLEWLLRDYAPPRGKGPLLGEFADAATGLTDREEALLFAMLLAPVRAYEVTEAMGPRGIQVKDLLVGEESRLGLLGLPESPGRFDLLICRLLPLGRLVRPGAGLLVLPGTSRGEMLAYLRSAYRLARPARHISLEDFLDGSAHLYHHFFLIRGRSLGGRTLETVRRAAFAPAQLRYRGTETSRIRAGLDRQQELERQQAKGDEIRYFWIDLLRGLVRGEVCVRPGELLVSAETREDLEDARRFLEGCLRGLIQPMGEPMGEPTLVPPSEVARAGSRTRGAVFLSRILNRWPDMPSPHLNDQTPREACRTRTGRQRVAGLVLGIERDLARQKRLGRAWADVTPLREELNLPVPSR